MSKTVFNFNSFFLSLSENRLKFLNVDLFNNKSNLPYNLRNIKTLGVPHINSPFIGFRSYILNNLESFCNKFVDNFEKFDIAHKN